MIDQKTQLTVTIRPNEKEKYNAKLFVMVELDGQKMRGYADTEIQAAAVVAQATAALLGQQQSEPQIAEEIEAEEIEAQPDEPTHTLDDLLDPFLDDDAQKGGS